MIAAKVLNFNMTTSLPYESLDVDNYEVRLLSLHPGEPGSELRCDLSRVNLMRVHDYSALSYCWGDENLSRNIIVNGFSVSVTRNLADALHRLRELSVTQIWADALCINQSDKAERGNHVRIMKEIYSRAITVYAWLDQIGNHQTGTSMRYPSNGREISERKSTEVQRGTAGSKFPHHNTVADTGYSLARQTCCNALSREDGLKTLLDILDCEYWKRHWIILELSAAVTVFVLYNREVLAMIELETALERHRHNHYWQPVHEITSWYFQRALRLRKVYQAGNSPSICQAMVLANGSRCKDPRDNIFALVSMCGDGLDLVSRPDYSQEPADIARDFTREVLRKYACFDIILVAPRPILPCSTYPSWAPDWLSGNLPEIAGSLPYEKPVLDYQYALNSLRSDPGTLIVQGVLLATIVALTSVVGSVNSTPTIAQKLGSPIKTTPQSCSLYYDGRAVAVGDALISCLLYKPLKSGRPYRRLTVINCFNRILQRTNFSHTTHIVQEELQAASGASFPRWLHANRQIVVCGQPLDDFFRSYLLDIRKRILLSRFVLCVMLLAFPCMTGFGIYLMVKHYSLKAGFILISIGAFMTLMTTECFWGGLYLLTRGPDQVHANVRRALRQDRKVAITDQGMLAMVCSNAEVGDKICFVAGCSGAVILRPSAATNENYYVIGKAFASLSKKDASKYAAFDSKRYVPSENQRKDRKRRINPTKLIEKYRKADWWREFILV